MLANFAPPDPRRAYCGDCRGTGFDKVPRKQGRHATRCQRCRGQGSIAVGKVRR